MIEPTVNVAAMRLARRAEIILEKTEFSACLKNLHQSRKISPAPPAIILIEQNFHQEWLPISAHFQKRKPKEI
jgi:hypothetical protein